MTKRSIFTTALVLCLVALLGFASLAYFTDNDKVTNTFKTAASDDPNTPLFDLDLYEDIDDDGTPEDGNEYEDILPGTTVAKDPTVKNTGEYSQYVRLHVTVSNATAWQAACAAHNIELTSIFGTINADWTLDEDNIVTDNDTVTYTYYYGKVLEPGNTSTLFETVTIPTAFTVADMEGLREFTIDIVGEAIQSENTADNAFDAFKLYPTT